MSIESEPCIWMAAGLFAYRLCDRDFDCDHCPLDAALHGRPGPVSLGPDRNERGPGPLRFPSDRRYSQTHLWLRGDQNGARIGLDAFAASLLASSLEIFSTFEQGALAAGDLLCEVDIGVGRVRLRSPVGGLLVRRNERLEDRPHLLVSDPYGDGWIGDMTPDEDPADNLHDGPNIAVRSELDLRRFRRRSAQYMLADDRGLGPTLPDGGVPLTDLRLVLGGAHYCALAQELVG